MLMVPICFSAFCRPIRAAGGTAQALAVLIADMIRRELNIEGINQLTRS